MGPHRKAFNEFNFKVTDVGLDPGTIETLSALVKAYRAAFESVVETSKSLRQDQAAFHEASRVLVPLLDALLDSARQGMSRAAETQRLVRDAVVERSVAIAIGLLGGFVVISLLVTFSITRPLRAIERVMERLAGGDQAAIVPGTNRADEIQAEPPPCPGSGT
ncbi:hypothetical protein CCP1ISM_3540002 [Azospirillaceae bacterium]